MAVKQLENILVDTVGRNAVKRKPRMSLVASPDSHRTGLNLFSRQCITVKWANVEQVLRERNMTQQFIGSKEVCWTVMILCPFSTDMILMVAITRATPVWKCWITWRRREQYWMVTEQ